MASYILVNSDPAVHLCRRGCGRGRGSDFNEQRHEEDETFSRLSQNKLVLTPSLRHTLALCSLTSSRLRLYVELDLAKRFSLNARIVEPTILA